MKPTQKQSRELWGGYFTNEYGMSVELDAPWGTFDVDIGYLVHKGDRDHPQMYEIVGVWLGSWEISHYLNHDYILDLCADDYIGSER